MLTMLPSRWIFEHAGEMAFWAMALFPIALALTIFLLNETED